MRLIRPGRVGRLVERGGRPSGVQQPAALVQRLVDEVEVAVFQVAQGAVDELRRQAARAGGGTSLPTCFTEIDEYIATDSIRD
jgi:hypothetical protein